MIHRHGLHPCNFLRQQNGHLMAVPLVVYKALFATFGAASYAPFRFVAIALYLLCAGLFFALTRERVGDAFALLASVVLLFLGTAWEQSLSAIGLILWISLAAGLGMLLALQARSRRRDVVACLLLGVSLASFSYGLAFAVAAAVKIVLEGAWRRRAWVVLVPLALYGLWLLAYGRSGASLSNIAGAPVFVANSLGAALESRTGLYPAVLPTTGPVPDVTWRPPLAPLI